MAQAIKHRWAHQDFGKKGALTNGNMSFSGIDFYSYGTVIAQWLDKTKKVIALINTPLSNTTSKHVSSVLGAIPTEVKIIHCHRKPRLYYYADVEFCHCGYSVDECEESKAKTTLCNVITALLEEAHEYLLRFKNSRKMSDYSNRYKINEIEQLIRDANWIIDNYKFMSVKNCKPFLPEKLYKLLERTRSEWNFSELIDYVNGKGTFEAYHKRTVGQRNAEKKRLFMNKVNVHLGLRNTYQHSGGISYTEFQKKLKTREGRAEILGLHMKAYAPLEAWEKAKLEWHYHRKQNEKIIRYMTFGQFIADDVDDYCHVRNYAGEQILRHPFTGVEVNIESYYIPHTYSELMTPNYNFARHLGGYMDFKCSDFKKAKDKKQFRERFWQRMKILHDRRQMAKVWWDITTGRIDASQCNDEILNLYNMAQIKYLRWAENEGKKQVEAARIKAEAERIAMEKEAERNAIIDQYISEGASGWRKLYHEHYDRTPHAYGPDANKDLFMGGNVLLRWKCDGIIETSKGILLSIAQAKRHWKKVFKWHNNPSTFASVTLETKTGSYRADRYVDDILYAGCHAIAYPEMERMYNDILAHEQKAA